MMEPIDLSDVSSLERKMLEYQCLKARAKFHNHRFTSAIGVSLLLAVIVGKSYFTSGFSPDLVVLSMIVGYLVWEFFSEGMSRQRHAAAVALEVWMEENEEY
jgi:hypothetical protein